jgi:hypothetical protein
LFLTLIAKIFTGGAAWRAGYACELPQLFRAPRV